MSYGADINLCMNHGASPLFIAYQQGHESIVQLLRNTADKTLSNRYVGATPLQLSKAYVPDIKM